jgi:acetolactate decarboxylase
MLHEGRTGSTVALDAVLPNPDLYAVGALAGLSGEVTVLRGMAYLSHAEGADETRTEATPRPRAGATLLVAAEVADWRAVTISRPIRFEEFDGEIAELAAAAGMSLKERFPFLVEGDLEELQWHVVDGRRLTAGRTSHEDHLAAAVKMSLDRARATLVGFYSRNDRGVFTHMNSETHVHCVVDDPVSSGHVDHVTLPAGTTVKFPAGRGRRSTEATRGTDSAGR